MPLSQPFRPDRYSSEAEGAAPYTCALLRRGGLVIHPAVAWVALIGSRGAGGAPRPESDIDLSLVVDSAALPPAGPERTALLEAVLHTTLDAWRGPVELDLAAPFDIGGCCGLRCFGALVYDPAVVGERGVDCFGLYKIQCGFQGYVTSGADVRKIYPLIVLWSRSPSAP